MRVLIVVVCLSIFGAGYARADGFPPSEATINRIAQRFRAILDVSGINGVGKDVLRCYNDNLNNSNLLKECVVYDAAALIVDRTMLEIFIGQGVDAKPAALFTERVFTARQNTYGRAAFQNDERSMKFVGPAAQRVVTKVLPR